MLSLSTVAVVPTHLAWRYNVLDESIVTSLAAAVTAPITCALVAFWCSIETRISLPELAEESLTNTPLETLPVILVDVI